MKLPQSSRFAVILQPLLHNLLSLTLPYVRLYILQPRTPPQSMTTLCQQLPNDRQSDLSPLLALRMQLLAWELRQSRLMSQWLWSSLSSMLTLLANAPHELQSIAVASDGDILSSSARSDISLLKQLLLPSSSFMLCIIRMSRRKESQEPTPVQNIQLLLLEPNGILLRAMPTCLLLEL